MKIEQSSVAMSAGHEYVHESEFETVDSFRKVLSEASQSGEVAAGNIDRERTERTRMVLLLSSLVARMLELISSGKKSQFPDWSEVLRMDEAEIPSGGSARTTVMEWRSELTETVRERERTQFSTTGTVRTSDGTTIDFSLGLGMCRDYECARTEVRSGTVELRDPLVIDFSGSSAELSGQRFAFDLDADGTAEMIPGLAGGRAYLAFDGNADGSINDGSELFGTRTGDGFADLARLDQDGNRWLDEADAAFSSLRLWERDAAGKESLNGLREKGIGAIYLGSTATPFSLTTGDNEKLGYVRASGVYLREDGSAGAVQQVDLAV